MFIKRIEFEGTSKSGSRCKRVLLQFSCDTCSAIYEKSPGKTSKTKSGFTFCSNICKFAAHEKNAILNEEAKKTSLERYGNEIPMLVKSVKEKKKQTHQVNSGVDYPMQLEANKAKRRATNLERYGKEETFQVEKFVNARAETWLKRYGVPYVPFPPDAAEKSKLSMVLMPQKWSSKIELEFYDALCENFGTNDIVHQKWINGWPLDFYVKSLDTFIQFDGVYWHALDSPLEEIRKSSLPRDIARVQKWERDRKQDAWFSLNNKRLIRITDKQWKDSKAISFFF